MNSFLRLVTLCISVTFSVANLAYQLPDGAETLLAAPLQSVFDCAGRPYGYYADVVNNCQLFHVCLPMTDDQGQSLPPAHFSFLCGNGTMFSQEALTCVHNDLGFPCQEAEALYERSNADFGKVDVEFRAHENIDEVI